MRRKIVGLLAAALMASSLLAAPVGAWGGVDGTASCGDISAANRFAGENAVIPKNKTKHEGVKASFDAQRQDAFLTCHDSSGTDLNSASTAWVAIVPTTSGTPFSIMQVGLMRAEAPAPAGDGTIHMIASWGYDCPINPLTGCGGPIGTGPTPYDFGQWTSIYSPRGAIIHYCHDLVAGGPVCDTPTFDFWALVMTEDGSDPLTWASNPAAHYVTIHDDQVPWTVTGNYKATAMFETVDQGDQMGGPAADPYVLTAVQVTYTPDGIIGPPSWTTPGFKGACDVDDFLPTPGGTGVFPTCATSSNTTAGTVSVATPNR